MPTAFGTRVPVGVGVVVVVPVVGTGFGEVVVLGGPSETFRPTTEPLLAFVP
jgi:hypothetical protein